MWPEASATGMNSPGGTMPSAEWFQRMNSSAPQVEPSAATRL
jgi:hypothetical protein